MEPGFMSTSRSTQTPQSHSGVSPVSEVDQSTTRSDLPSMYQPLFHPACPQNSRAFSHGHPQL